MVKAESQYQKRLDGCLSKAAIAHTSELKELWQTMADSYRALLESESRAISYQSWQRNNVHSERQS